MDKKFIKVPEGRFEKIMFAAVLAETLSGNKTTREQIMKTVNEENLELTEEQIMQLNAEFPA